jgi:glycosyltransferase involved in cell wall biosynthesis
MRRVIHLPTRGNLHRSRDIARCKSMSEAPRPLRIAHLSFSALPRSVGGLEIVVDSLIRNQAEAGHAVTLVTRWKQCRAFRGAGFPYPALALPPNLRVHSDPLGPVGPRWPVAAAVRWHQWRHRFDIWHIHWLFPTGWMAHDALVGAGVPVVLTAHGADIETDADSGHGFRLNPRHDRRVRDLVQRAACLTAISPSVEARYLELGAQSDSIQRIPNGVDFSRFHDRPVDPAAVRARHGIPADRPLVLTVGRNRPAKGHRFVPAALAALLRAGRRVSWAILGGDPDAMRAIARAEGVEEHLHVVPAILGEVGARSRFPADAVIDLYKAAEVFALPSLSEGFGLAAVEAMAAGLPVVATDVPGLRHVVRDGTDGLLCPPADPEGMAAAIGRVLDDKDLRRGLTNAALETASAHDWQAISSRYLDLYRDLIGGAAR